MTSALDLFSEPTRAWFEAALGTPTDIQEKGWREVARGAHTLMAAPTGSGKTLAAFLWAIDRLAEESTPPPADRCRVLYISPLKALAVDIDRNLRAPLQGVAIERELRSLPPAPLRAAIRTGDTPAQERREIERHPPDVLITTPESLFLLLTSAARRVLKSVRWVIVDEIHAVAGDKRGAHLALSLERLAALTDRDPQRIGLSATVRPLDEVARFLGGDREVAIADAGRMRAVEVSVQVPVDDMADLAMGAEPLPSGPAAALAAPLEVRRSIWPALQQRLLELVLAHRSTIVFVNSRRLAERLAARLNELSGEDLVRAHHGSIAREQRLEIEDALKRGSLRGLVATSSLELGIDMGAVDLVVQVEAPPSVANGLQRIGRAGHSVGEVSRGVLLPKYRGDLLEAAAVTQRMLRAEIEAIRVPQNPIDVLAQHVVAMCALEEQAVGDVGRVVRRAHPFRRLGDRALASVLDMLSGRYPSTEFAELRPRLTWDRLNDRLKARPGAQRLAVTNAGTIPDRGLYTVNLLEDGKRVGELDEEMVFESRVGETFVLGASTWRIAEITQSQVLVTPAPGEPGKIAFWKGDTPARPAELGRSLGALVRELRGLAPDAAGQLLQDRCGLDEQAAVNLVAYLEDQAAATGAVPDDRTIVIERFRDEVGDWRVCLLTPYGGRVHAPWALALRARLGGRLGIDVRSMHADDGIVLQLPDVDDPPELDELLLDPQDMEELLRAELPGSALFAAAFRESAARALLLPRKQPGRRTPLWQQRQRGGELLQAASRHPDFPILAEAYRECMNDFFDLPALRDLLAGVRSHQVRVVAVDTERASPFAASLLFDYVGQYLYEGDQPLAERRAQALALDRELLQELLGEEELRELLDPEAMAELELDLQGLRPERWPRDVDEAHDVLARLGDLEAEELEARGLRAEWVDELRSARRALRVRIGRRERLIAVEDAAVYRDALGVALPPGLPAELLGPAIEPLEQLLTRWARTHVPFGASEPAQRWGVPVAQVEAELAKLAAADRLVAGEFRPGGRGREYSHPEVLRSLRRRSLAALRREVEAVPRDTLARFLPAWQGVGAAAPGLERLLEVVFQLQGLALPASVLERDVLPARVRDYSPRLLDELVSMGEVVWAGQGALGPSDGRVALYLRSEIERLLPEPGGAPASELHSRLRDHLERRGASFFRELLAASGEKDQEVVLEALWDLVWSGEVTNDTYGPLRGLGPVSRRPRRPRLSGLTPPRAAGRWSLLGHGSAAPTERWHAQAGALLQRHGVLTREAVLAEGRPGGFAQLYPVLRAMEEAGRVRRGYFVGGMGGSQFALPGAVDRLRSLRDAGGDVLCLAATDPAQPFGAVLPWPEGGRMARQPGAYVVLDGGSLACYLERGGRTLQTAAELTPRHLRVLADAALRAGKLEIQMADGQPVHESSLAGALREVGFGASPRGMVLYPKVAGAGGRSA
ncbi:MAG TPA: DEAD/DEAH box helicase [Candidatus Dormibacteraeota bacterium]